MAKTSIEWATDVWNPVTGCTKVSQGCKHCYAERVAGRFWKDRPFSEVICHEDRLEIPLRWKKPRRVFVNSMSDLFHTSVPISFIDQVFSIMQLAADHTFMVLTKRPDRMLDWFYHLSSPLSMWESRHRVYNGAINKVRDLKKGANFHLSAVFDQKEIRWPLPNVWLGVSVENQPAADERIPLLLKTPAAKRFVSCEPMLGPVDLWGPKFDNPNGGKTGAITSWKGGLDWVICGGESGPGARPMHPDWARGLRDQCQAAGVPYFFKQWGEWRPEFLGEEFEPTCAVCGCTSDYACPGGCYWIGEESEDDDMRDRCSSCAGIKGHRWPDGSYSYRVGKKRAGWLLDGRAWREFPDTNNG